MQIKVNPHIKLLQSNKSNIKIGRYTYGSPKLMTWTERDKITIGSFCSIADEVVIMGGGEHRIDWITTHPLRVMFDLPGAHEDGVPHTKGETRIGNDVWIGYRAIILSGVTIGDGAVIGAGAVVANDIDPYAIAAGNPCKVIQYRFDKTTRKELLRIKWWDWPLERIIDNIHILCSTNREALKRFVDLDDLSDR